MIALHEPHNSDVGHNLGCALFLFHWWVIICRCNVLCDVHITSVYLYNYSSLRYAEGGADKSVSATDSEVIRSVVECCAESAYQSDCTAPDRILDD